MNRMADRLFADAIGERSSGNVMTYPMRAKLRLVWSFREALPPSALRGGQTHLFKWTPQYEEALHEGRG